jgi:hypothetical protein
MHLRGASDVVLALFLAAKPAPFLALFQRQFFPVRCRKGARHDLLSPT